MKRRTLVVSFWLILALLALCLVLTIIGSAANVDAVLYVGVIGWLVDTFLFFIWLVLWFWSRVKRYPKGIRQG